MPTFEGDSSAPDSRYAVVAARFNLEIVNRLVEGAVAGFRENGDPHSDFDLFWVPGSFELPLVAQRLGDSGKYHAIICLGAVIKGDTDHYEYVCRAATDGIMRSGLDTGVPVIFGVLTCQTEEQALARSGGSEGNKGYDAALAAIRMCNLMRQLPV